MKVRNKIMMSGTLYVIGVGPGDPDLLTLKAVKILKNVSCLCVPKGRDEGSSLALSIVQKAVDLKDKEIMEAHFPMKKTRSSNSEDSSSDLSELNSKWNSVTEAVLSKINNGEDVAFITLGDPSIYSTFFYLYDRLLKIRPDLNIEIIPGVSSINAAASRAKISLGLADDKIAIVPATYTDDEIKNVIGQFETVVFMKVHKVLGSISKTIKEMNLRNAVYISRVGFANEKIFTDIDKVTPDDLDYFSVLIVKKKGEEE